MTDQLFLEKVGIDDRKFTFLKAHQSLKLEIEDMFLENIDSILGLKWKAFEQIGGVLSIKSLSFQKIS